MKKKIFWLNSAEYYGLLAVLLHWLMAIWLIGLFLLGDTMMDLDYYHPWYHDAREIHKGLGILAVSLMLFRFLWNHLQTAPVPLIPSEQRWQIRLARTTHLLLYILVLLLLISGYLISTAKGQGIDVFGWFDIPALLSNSDERADIAGEIHELLANTFIILVVLHALAAVKHHFFDKDETLRRMLGIHRSGITHTTNG